MTRLYPLFVLVAATTVCSPGPGVVMTLTNSLRYGRVGTLGGILGLACGALAVAAISATGLGLVLAASATAFTAMKLVGACYLVYLGVRLWSAPPFRFSDEGGHEAGFGRRLVEGLSLQVTNPKAIFFFLSVFPQFIEPGLPYGRQFAVLVLTYATLILTIHSIYALCARRARSWLGSDAGGRTLNRVGGATFLCFGAALAVSRR